MPWCHVTRLYLSSGIDKTGGPYQATVAAGRHLVLPLLEERQVFEAPRSATGAVHMQHLRRLALLTKIALK